MAYICVYYNEIFRIMKTFKLEQSDQKLLEKDLSI